MTDSDPDPGDQWITDPAGSGFYLDIFVIVDKKYFCQTGSKSLNKIKCWIFFENFFKYLLNSKDRGPDPGGQLITDTSDPQMINKYQ